MATGTIRICYLSSIIMCVISHEKWVHTSGNIGVIFSTGTCLIIQITSLGGGQHMSKIQSLYTRIHE